MGTADEPRVRPNGRIPLPEWFRLRLVCSSVGRFLEEGWLVRSQQIFCDAVKGSNRSGFSVKVGAVSLECQFGLDFGYALTK